MRLLPSIKPNDANYFVDVFDFSLDHDGCIAVARLSKQLGERLVEVVHYHPKALSARLVLEGLGELAVRSSR